MMTDRMSVQLNGKNSSSCNRRDEHWLPHVITFDQNGYHLYTSSAGEKDLFNDTQINGAQRCTRMLRHFSEKSGAKFPVRTLSYLANHCQKKKRKGEKGKANKKVKKKTQKPKGKFI